MQQHVAPNHSPVENGRFLTVGSPITRSDIVHNNRVGELKVMLNVLQPVLQLEFGQQPGSIVRSKSVIASLKKDVCSAG